MGVVLSKGQKISLKKQDGNTLKNVIVGLGWDEMEQEHHFWSKPKPIDCDATAFLCQGGKVVDISDVVYYGNLTHKSRTVKHMGDNLTGEGEGDDEQIFVDLQNIPNCYDKIIIVVNIYDAYNRNQHFGLIQNAFARVVDLDTNKEICRYNLSENYANYTGLICGELTRENGAWSFNAIGNPVKVRDLNEILAKFR